jgi:hypothetical protein
MSHFYLPPASLDILDEDEWVSWLDAEYKRDPESRHVLSAFAAQQNAQATATSQRMYRHAKLLQLPLQKQGRVLWAKLFMSVFSEKQLMAWQDSIPKFGCSCDVFYQEFQEKNPPVFPLCFEWKHKLKSAVNEKLKHPTLDLETGRHVWRQIAPIRRSQKVPAVSSLSPNNLARQVRCVESWITSGFDVILLQTRNEIEAYRKLFPRAKFIEATTERPMIRDMARYGMIINSDCEMYGEGPGKLELNSFYLRWNYDEGRASREEEWGLDACYVDHRTLPEDFSFQIGKPFWDYAVPAILRNKNISFKINHVPWLHHLKHKINWTKADWHEGHNWVTARFTGDYSSPSYRVSIDPDYAYSKQLGMWVKK